jgi:hypothetical protein
MTRLFLSQRLFRSLSKLDTDQKVKAEAVLRDVITLA